MNDASFIIISSDEESNANNVPKTDEISFINKRDMEAVENVADSTKKQYSKKKLTEQEKSQYSQVAVTQGISKLSSENPSFYISKQSQDTPIDSQVLRNSKYWAKDGQIKSEVESCFNKNNDNKKNMEMSCTFNKFLQLVLSIEEKEDDKAKLLKKITKYHNLADSKYLKSDDFNNLLEKSISKLTKDQAFLYFVVKEILDCLLSKRVLTEHKNTQNEKTTHTATDSAQKECGEGPQMEELYAFSDGDAKNYKTVKKLTKVLQKLDKKIKELEETEVDLSDEEDSVYLNMQRHRERYCQIYKKLCTYSKEAATAKRACTRRITFSGTYNLQLDRAVETWLNKTNEFPDYASVLKFLRKSNDNLQLGMAEEVLKKLAIDIFVKIGNSLQLRRKYDLWDSLNPFLENNIDPSTSDSGLKERLELNYEIAVEKEKEILNYYADLQRKHSLQPAEVPDEEANESPVESGDEDEKELEAVENDLSSKIPVEIDGNVVESEAEENDEEECRSHIVSDHDATNVDSEKSNASLNPECVHSCSDNDKYEESNKTTVTKNAVGNKFTIKKHEGKDADNNKSTVLAANQSPEIQNRKCVKRKAKVTKGDCRDDNSDCELVVLVSDEEASFKYEKDNNCKVRKVHQVNYAFINNNFNHNTTPTDDLVVKRKNTSFCFKSGKTQRSLSLPLSDLTNIKHITNKYARFRGGLEKRKFQECIRLHPFERSRFRHTHVIIPGKMSNHCALQNESDNKKLKSQNESDQANEKDSCEKSSNDGGGANNGASGGGSGEDNNEDDGKKKPYDQEERIDDNQGMEDDDEDNEEVKAEKEGFSKHEGDSKAGETDESNSIEPVTSQSVTKRSGNDPVVGSSQLQNNRMDPPESKIKSVTTKEKRIMGNKIRVEKSGGPPGTSRFASVKYPSMCKPYDGNVKTARDRPKQVFPSNLSHVDMCGHKKRESTSAKIAKSDEEIVKNFLQHSPSSISITSPRKRPIENKPSPSILQAIQTLSRLKGITTTVVKASCPQREKDIAVVGESPRSTPKTKKLPTSKSSRSQSFVLPKIVTIQGNVSGFENMDSDTVVVNLPDNKAPSPRRRRNHSSQFHITTEIPGNSENARQIRSTREPPKDVEYVVLE